MAEERLQKLIAHAGLASRRAAEELISTGQVTVNGKMATLGDKADPEKDDIRVAGQRLKFEEQKRYILLYKTRGTVCTTTPQSDKRTVLDVVKAAERLYPAGQLDTDSDGLVLLTNDGELTNLITHPRYGHTKTYRVRVLGNPVWETLEKWRNGVMLDDKLTAPCKVTILESREGATVLEIVMREGRKRQIRRVAELLGHPVQRLTRTKIGSLEIGQLKPGQHRELKPGEVTMLKTAHRRKPRSEKAKRKRNRP